MDYHRVKPTGRKNNSNLPSLRPKSPWFITMTIMIKIKIYVCICVDVCTYIYIMYIYYIHNIYIYILEWPLSFCCMNKMNKHYNTYLCPEKQQNQVETWLNKLYIHILAYTRASGKKKKNEVDLYVLILKAAFKLLLVGNKEITK